MTNSETKKKERYEVEVNYRSKIGNACTCRRIIMAESIDEAIRIINERVEKFKNYLKTDGGTARLLN